MLRREWEVGTLGLLGVVGSLDRRPLDIAFFGHIFGNIAGSALGPPESRHGTSKT
jgi:hypothetical protein